MTNPATQTADPTVPVAQSKEGYHFAFASGSGSRADPFTGLKVDGSSAGAPVGTAPTDKSIASVSGSSETIAAANTSRRKLFIYNPSNTIYTVNVVGGATAVAGAAGTVALNPGDWIEIDHTAIVTGIGTAAAKLTAYER